MGYMKNIGIPCSEDQEYEEGRVGMGTNDG
jgi:hypothetical protein